MRFIFAMLLVLVLTACVSQGPSVSNFVASATAITNSGNQQIIPKTLRKIVSAKGIICVDQNLVGQLMSVNNDLWARIRRGFQIPNLRSSLVDLQANWYSEHPDYVARMTERSMKYLYHIVEELEARNMPTELALLPFIESAYNPRALSIAKAAGMWQFVPDTGRTYNLKQNIWQDERRDVLASTNAALDYLSRLYDMFGGWHLALAAYNWGEGNVQRACTRNELAGLPTDYQSLRLPNETRNYVPKLQAIKNIVMDPKQYGLILPFIPNHRYFVTVTMTRDIDVGIVAQLANMTPDEFHSLNPSFKKPVILGATQPQILLPFDNVSAFKHNLKKYTGPLSSWTTYTVTKRARATTLAEKIGIGADMLRTINKIPAGMRLKPGSILVVPRSNNDDDEDISANLAQSAMLTMEPDMPDTCKRLIRMHRKQSIAIIAGRYGVSVRQLKKWNMTRRDFVIPGQVLVLHVPITKAMLSEPGPMKLATKLRESNVETMSTCVSNKNAFAHYNKKSDCMCTTSIAKVSNSITKKLRKPSITYRPATKHRMLQVVQRSQLKRLQMKIKQAARLG